MKFIRNFKSQRAGLIAALALALAAGGAAAQDKTFEKPAEKSAAKIDKPAAKTAAKTEKAAAEPGAKELAGLKYRFLQSNGLLVESAFLQEKGELQHAVAFTRSSREGWTTRFLEEIPLGSDRHQLSVELPARLVRDGETGRGAGDVRLSYNYLLVGGNAARVTVAPGLGVALATGDARRATGRGANGYFLTLPVSVMLGKRFAANASFGLTVTPHARSGAGLRARTADYELGESFVWFAKPRFNLLVETIYEREQRVAGAGERDNERRFHLSPGVRWAHRVGGLLIVPSVGVPFGIGPSGGERGLFFALAFEHSIGPKGD